MNPIVTLVTSAIVETCSGMVITRALKPIVNSASGLTKVALWVGSFGLSTAGGALAANIVIKSINDGLKLGDEIVDSDD